MANLMIQAEPRSELGKNANRRLRARGKIPAVIYGPGFDATSISVDPDEVDRILQSETGHNTIFELEIGGNSRQVLIKDYQLHPVTDQLMHADFQAIAMDQLMEFEVRIEIAGVPKGVRNTGGVLDMVLREIKLECLPIDVPDRIRIDVTELEIGDAIRVADLQVDTSKVTVLSEPDLVLVTVVPPHVEKEPEVVVVEPVVEPEVIRKGKVEEEGEARPGAEEEE